MWCTSGGGLTPEPRNRPGWENMASGWMPTPSPTGFVNASKWSRHELNQHPAECPVRKIDPSCPFPNGHPCPLCRLLHSTHLHEFLLFQHLETQATLA